MFALIYLGLAIALGDLLCRRFYQSVSIAHRWAAAVLVGVLLSTWFTYLAGIAFYRAAEPLLWADLLFFLTAASAIFCLSRKTPKMSIGAPRAPESSTLDWIVPGALFAAVSVLLIGTLYVNKQGRISLAGMYAADFPLDSAIAQNFALGRNFSAYYPHYLEEPSLYRFLFFFQAGNLEFLGLNLAWSIDLLSVLALTSVLALVVVLGELLFNSRIAGYLGATLFLFHGSLRYLTNFLSSDYRDRDETGGFWKELAFVNHRHLPFAIGIALLVLILFANRYRQRTSATATDSDVGALQESNGIAGADPALRPVRSLVFSALLLASLPLRNAQIFIGTAMALGCLLLAYGLWRLSSTKVTATLGRILAGALTTCIVVAGVVDLLAICRGSRIEVNYETQPLVYGFVFRNFLTYKIPESLPPRKAPESLPKSPVTAFEGGRGQGSGQFDRPQGLATDSAGNIFVADTGNGRIQKFSPTGVFLSAIGTKGSDHGQFGEPSGVAVDQAGNIYVVEASNHRVQKLAPNGTFISEWAPGLYGPRRIAIGPDASIYVVDQGRSRIVKLNPDGKLLTTWGSGGSGDGQMRDPTSVAVDSTNNRVYVADPINSRIQIFDSSGTFLTKFSIPEWGKPQGFEDLAIDPDRGRLYASSAYMNAILVFDLQGNRLGPLQRNRLGSLTQTLTDNPSALALAKGKLFVLNGASSRVSVVVLKDR